jgi:NADPH:quinone reductase-like Zn-dependent oxidoreductase
MSAGFKPGDRVLVNGGSVAEILVYDVPTDVLVVVSKAGSSTDRATYPLCQTRLEHLIPEQPELPLPTPAKGSK